MPAHYELHYGYPDLESACSFLIRENISIVAESEDSAHKYQDAELIRKISASDYCWSPADDWDRVENKLHQAWLDSIDELGWKILGHVNRWGDDIPLLDTPYGQRETSGWNLVVQYDPDEVGDTIEQLSIGVNLTSRYFPIYLDMSDPHGTIPLVFNTLMEGRIEVAKRNIKKHVPSIGSDAVLFVRDIFY